MTTHTCGQAACVNPRHSESLLSLAQAVNTAALAWAEAEFSLGRNLDANQATWRAAQTLRSTAHRAFQDALRQIEDRA